MLAGMGQELLGMSYLALGYIDEPGLKDTLCAARVENCLPQLSLMSQHAYNRQACCNMPL